MTLAHRISSHPSTTHGSWEEEGSRSFRDFLEPLALEAFITTADGTCVYANEAARLARGGLLMGRRCVELGLPAAVHDEILGVLADRRSRTRSLGDEGATVSVCVSPSGHDRALVMVLGSAGAGRPEREATDLAARVLGAATLGEVMDVLLHDVVEALEGHEATLLLEPLLAGLAPVSAHRGMPDEVAASLRTLRADGPGELRDALALGTPFYAGSRRALARELAVPGGFWVGSPASRAFVALPLCDGQHRVVATLLVAFHDEQRFPAAQRTRVAGLLARLGPALDRAIAHERLRLERERAARAEHAKDELLSMVAHELGTPLSTVLGWASLLRSRPPEPELLEKGLEAIVRNAKAQARMVDDLLVASRLATGRVVLTARRCDAGEIVKNALDDAGSAAHAKSLTLGFTAAAVPAFVFADPDRLRRLLASLLDNAVKFSRAGQSIEVSVTQRASEVVIAVTDHGEGLEREHIERLFDEGAPADRSTTRKFRGLGLGLTVAQKLAELHGGTLGAASDGPGKGATFTLVLPAERA